MKENTIWLLLAWLLIWGCSATAQSTDWPQYGRDAGGQRFAPISQIDSSNVAQLSVAWQFRTGEIETYQDNPYLLERAAFEATPIMIDGTLYFPTPSNRVYALDAATGQELWQFDPQVNLQHTEFSELTCRGVSYWPGSQADGQGARIVLATIDARLFVLDANTGQPDPAFGRHGQIDLKEGVGHIQVTSAPAIYRDVIIVGSSMGDNGNLNKPRGVVRAYAITTGALLWSWDPIPTDPSDPAYAEWKSPSAIRTGAANAWATISVDAAHGLVYIPTSCPSPDFYGGERLGRNDYANSIVALSATDGSYRWHFQTVHHDIWDYDIPAQPVLFQYDTPQGSIPAVAVGTKMGHIFVLNRLTGEPIFPIEERPVPTSTVRGEVTHPTQPFPVLPAPLGLQQLSIADVWGPSANEEAYARKMFASMAYEGIFTPPTLMQGTLVAPGNLGGIHWGGMTYDPDRQILVTNINNFAHTITLLPRHDLAQLESYFKRIEDDDNAFDPPTNEMSGTPYYLSRNVFIKSKDGKAWPMTRPPWGQLIGIDLRTGQKMWEKPLGMMLDPTAFPAAKEWGSINMGGSITTASGLTFVAATMDNHLRAFSTTTGEELWAYPLPASGIATPMTYQVDGKQYLVIAAGGHGKNPLTKKGDYVIAFAL